MVVDEENTTFESNPLGNRQRLKPRDSFVARNKGFVPASTMVIEDSMITETIDESISEGMFTMSDVVLPANALVHAAVEDVPLPSLLPQPAALMLLPREIDYHVAAQYQPVTESHNALPVASRRVRYLAVPALAALALVVLGGAAMPPDVEAMQGPAASVAATREATSAPRVMESAHEPPAPIEIVEIKPVAKPVVRAVVKQPRSRKVVVNASSALGNLRPGRAF